jgi:hypothetical protein
MKHASPATIERLGPLLEKVRSLGRLSEKKPGIFYLKSRAFLHFHEDGDEIYADLRLDGSDFERLPCTNRRDQQALVTSIRDHLAG